MDRQVFKVHVLEGRGFGAAPQALHCSASLAGEDKSTSYSVSTDAHAWNSSLAWVLDKDEARKAKSVKVRCIARRRETTMSPLRPTAALSSTVLCRLPRASPA